MFLRSYLIGKKENQSRRRQKCSDAESMQQLIRLPAKQAMCHLPGLNFSFEIS
jgi:hypothetical protein